LRSSNEKEEKTMTAPIYHFGDTIRIEAKFYTFAGVLADLAQAPTIKMFDGGRTNITPEGAQTTRTGTGTYHYDYTMTKEGPITYEFAGSLENSAIVRRGTFMVKFV
jgi:hypothetical protein